MHLSPEVSSVLSRSRISGNLLYLPPEQLDRKLYEKVNNVLTAMGGVWKKKLKAHEFPSDTATDIGEMIGAALKSSQYVDPKAEFEFFETPPPVIDRLISLSGLDDRVRSGIRFRILEPSAGRGAIACTIRSRFGISPFCCELMPENREALRRLSFDVVADDFLAYSPDTGFDLIIANPPFSGGQDCAHVRHMYDLLAPGGRLVSVTSTGWLFRNDRKFKEFREWAQEHLADWYELEEKAFKSSGTGVNTLLIRIDKTEEGENQMADIAPVDFTSEPEDTGTLTLEDFERDTAQAQALSGTPPADNPAGAGTGGLLSLTDISKLTGLSYVTLRRYAGVHSKDLLPYTEGTGRSIKYKPAAVEMFKRYREESRSGPKPGGGRARTQQPASTSPPTPAAPAALPRPTRGRPAGKVLNPKPKKKGKPSRPHKPTIVSAPESAPGPVMQEMIRAMDRAVAEMERAQVVTRLETLRGVVGPINKEVERLEKMVGMVKA